MHTQELIPRILDAHHHFWDLSGQEGHYPWLQDAYDKNFFLGDYTPMLHNFLAVEYRTATAGYNVIGTIHMEAERARNEQVAESQFLKRMHDAAPRFPAAVVGHATLEDPNLTEVLEGHAKLGIVRGIRSKPVTATSPNEIIRGPRSMHDPNWLAGLAKLMDYDFSWDLRVPYWHLSEAAAMLTDFPKLQVIINHCGLPLDRCAQALRVWRKGMEALAKLPHMSVKISELGLPNNTWDRVSNEAVVRDAVSIFGFERSMFASNLPVSTLTAANFGEVVATVLAGVKGARREQLDLLFCGTAARVYRVALDAL